MKKKGFTLIELLAVIIILAVIALIATPIVLNVVDEAKKGAFESSANGLIDAIKYKSMEDLLDGNSMVSSYTFPSENIKVQGSQPTGGTASVDKDGNIQIAVHNGKWCAVKSYTDSVITIKEYVEGECKATESGYVAGDYVTVQLASGITKNFYVLSIDGDKLTLIMDRNLGDDIAWGNYGDTTPTIAVTQLTNLGWSNASEVRLPYAEELMAQTEWYKGLTDIEKANWESKYIEDLTAAASSGLLSCSSNAECRTGAENAGLEEYLLPMWLDVNLYTSGDSTEDNNGYYKYAYWTQDPVSADPDRAWFVLNGGIVFHGVVDSDGAGVRPVITIDKSHIIDELDAPIYVDSGFTRE